MNNYIYIGKIINTFGIKGELKLRSDFEYINEALKKGNTLYIGEYKQNVLLEYVRFHKNNYLIKLENLNNINDVLKYKGLNVFINREDLKLDENIYLMQDLIGFSVYDNDKLIGVVIDYERISNYYLLKVKSEKVFYIPMASDYIIEVLLNDKKIITKGGSDLIL